MTYNAHLNVESKLIKMKKTLNILSFSIFSLLFFYGQPESCNKNSVNFEKLTYHSSPCFGMCPDISMNIYKDRTVELSITKFKTKGARDTTRAYKGTISKSEYDTLMTYLKEIDWKTIEFSTENCCDAPIKSLILNYNGETRKYRSMFPPESTHKLFEFLYGLAVNSRLPVTNEPLEFEKVTD